MEELLEKNYKWWTSHSEVAHPLSGMTVDQIISDGSEHLIELNRYMITLDYQPPVFAVSSHVGSFKELRPPILNVQREYIEALIDPNKFLRIGKDEKVAVIGYNGGNKVYMNEAAKSIIDHSVERGRIHLSWAYDSNEKFLYYTNATIKFIPEAWKDIRALMGHKYTDNSFMWCILMAPSVDDPEFIPYIQRMVRL